MTANGLAQPSQEDMSVAINKQQKPAINSVSQKSSLAVCLSAGNLKCCKATINIMVPMLAGVPIGYFACWNFENKLQKGHAPLKDIFIFICSMMKSRRYSCSKVGSRDARTTRIVGIREVANRSIAAVHAGNGRH